MSHDFTLAGSEPFEFTMGLTYTDSEAFHRIFGEPPTHSLSIKGMPPLHPCPVCDELVTGGLVEDISITPTDRPNTFNIHGKSVTYTPCGHKAGMAPSDGEPA